MKKVTAQPHRQRGRRRRRARQLFCLVILAQTFRTFFWWKSVDGSKGQLGHHRFFNPPRVDAYSSQSPSFTVATLVKANVLIKLPESRERVTVLNALRSFTKLVGVSTVIVLTERIQACSSLPWDLRSSIRCEAAAKECMHERLRRPTMGCVLRELRALCQTESLILVNSDVILFDSVVDVMRHVDASLDNYVIVGQRHDVAEALTLDENLDSRMLRTLEGETRRHGILHGEYGLDYFVMRTRDIPTSLPEFVTGAWRWDNCLLTWFLSKRVHVVDGSQVITAAHQGVPTMREANHTLRQGAFENNQLAEKMLGRAFLLGRTDAADFQVSVSRGRMRLTRHSQYQAYRLRKCMLQSFSLHEPVIVGFAPFLRRKTEVYQESLGKHLHSANHVILTDSRHTLVLLMEHGYKVCLMRKSDANDWDPSESYPPASIVSSIIQMGAQVIVAHPASLREPLSILEGISRGSHEPLAVQTPSLADVVVVDEPSFYLQRVVSCNRALRRWLFIGKKGENCYTESMHELQGPLNQGLVRAQHYGVT